MHINATLLVLVTLTVRGAVSASVRHKHYHSGARKSDLPSLTKVYHNATPDSSARAPNYTHVRRDLQSAELLTSTDAARLLAMGCLIGQNALSAGAEAWIGVDGSYTNEFTNNADEDLILVVWGPQASWVNNNSPLITISLPQQASQTISFETGLSGAWSAVYSDVEMSNGQIANTWGEFTFNGNGTVDVSREINMSGHPISIAGPTCTSNMDTCVFVCPSSNECMTDYVLQNCENGSQAGANYGMFDGHPSGGCGWNGASSAALRTSFL